MVFNCPYIKLIEVLGGKASTTNKGNLVRGIALICFLKLPENNLLGADGVPEYTDFKRNEWSEYFSNNGRTLIAEF
jgi:hypothetical protein